MGFAHTPAGLSLPRTPKVNSTLQSRTEGLCLWDSAIPGCCHSEGRGQVVALPVGSSHQSRRRFLPFKMGPEGKCSANSCS